MKRLILWLFTLIGILATLAFVILEAYVWLTYGAAPAGDVPAWALYLMFQS